MLIQRLVRLAKRLLLIEKNRQTQLSKFQPKARLSVKFCLQVLSVLKKMKLKTVVKILLQLTERTEL
ncbi:hypothetical protein D6867_12165 [Streptococcus pseudopneumoniae]|uniref:Transposase n=1 Tax=Streptococcus pseudopneumoniae TaxID=257758 RepID=A0ABX9P8U2_9STRE|nr:hypothetical protein [Streptococcus pseudopneumoniae]RJY06477.1 hypothetical protein D6867_12165 [Streptococcus pseudopneumoniae]